MFVRCNRTIKVTPLYYTDIAEKFSKYDFVTIARAIGQLHETEKLWQDPRGRTCLRSSAFRGQAAGEVGHAHLSRWVVTRAIKLDGLNCASAICQ